MDQDRTVLGAVQSKLNKMVCATQTFQLKIRQGKVARYRHTAKGSTGIGPGSLPKISAVLEAHNTATVE